MILALVLGLAVPQGAELDTLRRAFCALPPEQRAAVLARAESAATAADPLGPRLMALAVEDATLPEATPDPFHDPDRWTQGYAPARALLEADSPLHAEVAELFPPVVVAPGLHHGVAYDWGEARLVRATEPLTDDQRFANLLHGYLPHSDSAIARVLAALDRDPTQRPIAEFLDHLYATRDGTVYAGVTLWQAWYSGEVVDVPDVDAIAFATKVLDDRSFRSPIPPDAKRDRLYGQLHDAARTFRQYRTLRELAAAALVSVTPPADPTYRDLLPRMQLLWVLDGEDLERAGARMATRSREDVLLELDQTICDQPELFAARDARSQRLATLQAQIRNLAIAALEQR